MDVIKVKGLVTLSVFDEQGTLKEQVQTNTITSTGLGYIADLLSNSPTKTKFDTAHSYVVLGTGHSDTNASTQTWVHTQTGSPGSCQAGYPTSGTFPNNTITWSFLFPAGVLNATGINEACLVNNPISGSGVSLAYAQITPAQNIASTDSLTLSWSITIS